MTLKKKNLFYFQELEQCLIHLSMHKFTEQIVCAGVCTYYVCLFVCLQRGIRDGQLRVRDTNRKFQ